MLFLSVSLGFKDETEQKIRCEENLLSNFYDFFCINIKYRTSNMKCEKMALLSNNAKRKEEEGYNHNHFLVM